jgi:hypothetical protein
MLKISFDRNFSNDEQIHILKDIVYCGGTVWFSYLLKKLKINGRSKIINSFRNSYYNFNSIGRTETDREMSCVTLLRSTPLENWVEYFLEDFPTRTLNGILIRSTGDNNISYEIKGTVKNLEEL